MTRRNKYGKDDLVLLDEWIYDRVILADPSLRSQSHQGLSIMDNIGQTLLPNLVPSDRYLKVRRVQR